MNPTPALGWGLKERHSLFERVRDHNFLALALIHHICVGGNVPLAEFITMLKCFGRAGVIEWVDKKDTMVQRLLRNRRDIFEDYAWENFKYLIERAFHLEKVVEYHCGTRKLCLVLPKRN